MGRYAPYLSQTPRRGLNKSELDMLDGLSILLKQLHYPKRLWSYLVYEQYQAVVQLVDRFLPKHLESIRPVVREPVEFETIMVGPVHLAVGFNSARLNLPTDLRTVASTVASEAWSKGAILPVFKRKTRVPNQS